MEVNGDQPGEPANKPSQERTTPPAEANRAANEDLHTQLQTCEKSPVMVDITLPGAVQCNSDDNFKEDHSESSREKIVLPTDMTSTEVMDDNRDDPTQKSIDELIAVVDTTLTQTSEQDQSKICQEKTRTKAKDYQTHKCFGESIAVVETTLRASAQSSSDEKCQENGSKSSQGGTAALSEQIRTIVRHENQDEQGSFGKSIALGGTTLPVAGESSSEETTMEDRTKSSQERTAPLTEIARTKVNDEQTYKSINKSPVGRATTLSGSAQNNSEQSNEDRKGFAGKALDTILSAFWPRKSSLSEAGDTESLPNVETTTLGSVRQDERKRDDFQSKLQAEREEAIPQPTDDEQVAVAIASTQIQKTSNSFRLTDSTSFNGSEELQSSEQKSLPVQTDQNNEESLSCASSGTSRNENPLPAQVTKSKLHHDVEIQMSSHKLVTVVEPVDVTSLQDSDEARVSSRATSKEEAESVGQNPLKSSSVAIELEKSSKGECVFNVTHGCEKQTETRRSDPQTNLQENKEEAMILDDGRARQGAGNCRNTLLTKRREELDMKVIDSKEGENSSRNDMLNPVAIHENDQKTLHGSTVGRKPTVSLEPTSNQKLPNLPPRRVLPGKSVLEKKFQEVRLCIATDIILIFCIFRLYVYSNLQENAMFHETPSNSSVKISSGYIQGLEMSFIHFKCTTYFCDFLNAIHAYDCIHFVYFFLLG
jgi:hypothetical protein